MRARHDLSEMGRGALDLCTGVARHRNCVGLAPDGKDEIDSDRGVGIDRNSDLLLRCKPCGGDGEIVVTDRKIRERIQPLLI